MRDWWSKSEEAARPFRTRRNVTRHATFALIVAAQVILFAAIGRGGTDRRLLGRDRRAVCLSECHAEPHLVIGDMAVGHAVDPFNEEIHLKP